MLDKVTTAAKPFAAVVSCFRKNFTEIKRSNGRAALFSACQYAHGDPADFFFCVWGGGYLR